ncbi:MAG: hypothetical protein ACKOX6_05715, partial [Bdellovibrio sp.]
MKNLKSALLKRTLQAHRFLLWSAGATVLIYGISGLSHTIMTWTTPQAPVFFPPTLSQFVEGLYNIPEILGKAGVRAATTVKVVPFDGQPILQVTEDPLQARRYFDLSTKTEIADGDLRQARWLASYYFKKDPAEIKLVEFQNEFDKGYPWVNRLLPVYKVHFESGLVAYVHTEAAVLAAVGTELKTLQQNIFVNLHSFEWLRGVPWLRFVVMLLMVGSLLSTTVAGFILLWQLKHQRKMDGRRKWHRNLAFVLVLPLIGFSLTGIARLVMNNLSESKRGPLMKEPQILDFSKFAAWKSDIHVHGNFSSISLVSARDKYYLRYAKAGGKQEEHVHNDQKFQGTPQEVGDRIYDLSGVAADFGDAELAQGEIAKVWPQARVESKKIVQSFGPFYDFRNKRLPVWQFELDNAKEKMVFVDPATG